MDQRSAVFQEALGPSSITQVRRPLWRRILLNPALISFAVFALLIWAAIALGPSAGAAGGCGGG